jgi:hypothetical protein
MPWSGGRPPSSAKSETIVSFATGRSVRSGSEWILPPWTSSLIRPYQTIICIPPPLPLETHPPSCMVAGGRGRMYFWSKGKEDSSVRKRLCVPWRLIKHFTCKSKLVSCPNEAYIFYPCMCLPTGCSFSSAVEPGTDDNEASHEINNHTPSSRCKLECKITETFFLPFMDASTCNPIYSTFYGVLFDGEAVI